MVVNVVSLDQAYDAYVVIVTDICVLSRDSGATVLITSVRQGVQGYCRSGLLL